MKYHKEAYRFVDQHVPQKDLLRTAAARVGIVRQMVTSPRYSNQTIVEGLAEISDILCLTNDEYRLVRRTNPPARR